MPYVASICCALLSSAGFTVWMSLALASTDETKTRRSSKGLREFSKSSTSEETRDNAVLSIMAKIVIMADDSRKIRGWDWSSNTLLMQLVSR